VAAHPTLDADDAVGWSESSVDRVGSWSADVHLRIVDVRVTLKAVCCKDLGDLSYIQQEKQRAQHGALWDTEQEVADF